MARKHGIAPVDIVRNAILAGLGLIVLVILGYSILYALGVFGNANGESFFTFDQRELETDPIEVVEFFSYSCPHCKNLEPLIASWATTQSDNVSFRRIHTTGSSRDKRLAVLHVVLEQRRLTDQFDMQIFEQFERSPGTFESLESIGEFVHGEGIEQDQFLRLSSSDRIQTIVSQNTDFTREIGVVSIPTILVGNKYVVRPGRSAKDTMRNLRELVQKITTGELPVQEESSDPVSTETEASPGSESEELELDSDPESEESVQSPESDVVDDSSESASSEE